ncbi:hypothetical protein B0J13DRAFT_295009 [Dactylonectria estremocensis]|uniref:Altered inheritance of mitochondria protein 6 n=1 Tax=Dactylonectria estremocensis TaxID=1079267 RepID=A0A9P9F0K4_9HYPO|nr:hypothetical protein B0J13DRAFT_295009 [Dactylonectria estremocensis]
MKFQGFYWGRNRQDPTEYERLPSTSPDDSWEPQSIVSQQKRQGFGLSKVAVNLWRTAVVGVVLTVTTLLLLYAFSSSGSTLIDPFEKNGNSTDSATKWIEELSSLVSPVMCHSHNDYLRPRPLFTALSVGCVSVEADVWLSKDGKDLLVAHHWWSLSSTKTLRSLYIDPLLQILDSMNSPTLQNHLNTNGQGSGVFATHPNTTLILFIDVKDDPATTWPVVLKQLQPLRDRNYLSRHEKSPSVSTHQSFWPGPITVVGTGNIAKRRDVNIGADSKRWQQYHDVFLDAPLDSLTSPDFCRQSGTSCLMVEENEFYTASVSFWQAIGTVLTGFSLSQLKIMRRQIRAAKQLHLKSRYWELPSWPISYRNYVWRMLAQEGVDLLNADDVVSAATWHWGSPYMVELAWGCGTASFLLSFSVTLAWLWRKMR